MIKGQRYLYCIILILISFNTSSAFSDDFDDGTVSPWSVQAGDYTASSFYLRQSTTNGNIIVDTDIDYVRYISFRIVANVYANSGSVKFCWDYTTGNCERGVYYQINTGNVYPATGYGFTDNSDINLADGDANRQYLRYEHTINSDFDQINTSVYDRNETLIYSSSGAYSGNIGTMGEFKIITTEGTSGNEYVIRIDDIEVLDYDPLNPYEPYTNSNSVIFSNTSNYEDNITSHPINEQLFITTFLNDTNWNFWADAFANLRVLDPDGLQVDEWSIYQQNASQFSFIPVDDGVYTAEIYCGILCYPFTGETEYVFSSNTVTVEYPYNSPDDLLFSHTLDYNTSITEHPLNESFYLNVWIEEGSSMRESDYFGHWRINVTSPNDVYLGTYYPVRSYYQGSYPIQISMDQFNGSGRFGNYTFKMFFALTPDDINNGEVLIKEAVIYLYNSSNYNDTGYYDNITQELGDVPEVDISNYTDIPELQFLNNSFSYDTFVWIATPIHTMHTGIDAINNYYSDTNNTQHITVLGSIVPILISELPEKVKLLFTYQIILTVILLIMGRD